MGIQITQQDRLLSGGHNCLQNAAPQSVTVLLIYVFVDLMELTMICLLLYAVSLTAQAPGQLGPCALPQQQACNKSLLSWRE